MSEDTGRESGQNAEGVSADGTAPAAGSDAASAQAAGAQANGGRAAGADGGASAKQMAANKANAKRSTGPRTARGKALVALNAVQHGLQGRFHLIAGEEPGKYQEFHDRIQGQLAPCGAMEEELGERVIAGFWRLRRIGRSEVL